MLTAPDFTTQNNAKGELTLALSGPLLLSSIGQIARQLRGIDDITVVDIAGVTAIDTVGAWTVWRTARDSGAEITGASAEAQRLITAVSGSQGMAEIAPPRAPIWLVVPDRFGRLVLDFGQGLISILGFFGALLMACGALIRHPQRFRTKALVRHAQLVGIDSLGIIGLMSFLIGITIAQQSASNLEEFGAQIYTINLVGRLSLREMGILMTAIMIAGRSGSSFAAQIGTMKLTEEVDAMRTIGVSPMEALVVPRVLATMLMMPLIGFFAAMAAIVGGATISQLVLDIPFWSFLARIQEVTPQRDLWVGLIKAPVFGLIIAVAGCYQGMQVQGNSEEVGLKTTLAVVQAIFLVIVLDAFFAIFFQQVGWG